MDTDGDGFNDETDACPGQPGSANGCPDDDGDGVADKDDACPNKPGTLDNKGCPKVMDTDGDGFNDENDACPGQPGTANGCPDQDRDGIADKDDLCPTEAGGATTKGCPDQDNDGTADKYDLCPDKPGTFEGCPDTDRDGTPDHKDACANEAGPASNKGCPVPAPVVVTAKDTDGDGVNDDLDKCPTSAGPVSNNGCPEIRKETKDRLTFAMQAVQFETGKAMLKGESYAILDEIVGILRQYPDYKLAISGHTDNIGDDGTNLRLSSDRAKTCYDYFAFRGISTTRLRYAGFGEMRPIASNESATGREMNRRVEFELTLD
jgi:outer membrane protein OmpA-like peptidoglycan-associated protein